ncbi:MAG: HAD-IA family hydrolase [Bermanella sp.]
MKYKAVIFDWDGTLVDSAQKIVESMQEAAQEHQLSSRNDFEIRQIIGLGLPEAIMQLWPQLTPDDARLQSMRVAYNRHYMAEVRPQVTFFGFATELLSLLGSANLDLAVATGKSRQGLERAFAEMKIGHVFRDSRCADETRSKPDPKMLQELSVSLGVEPEAMLMVGDTDFDMNMAHAAGVDAVAITHGAHDVARLRACEPLALVADLPDLLSWLQEAGLQAG